MTNSIMSVSCRGKSTSYCEDNLLMMYPSIEFPNVRFQVSVQMDEILANVVDEVFFFMYTSNPSYTTYLIALRYTLLCVSLIGLISFGCFYRGIQDENKTFEHKFILILSVALVLFNDPLYALTTYYGSIGLSIFSTIHVSMFFSFVIFFLMVMFPRMNFEMNKISSDMVTWTNIIFGLVIFVFMTLLLSIQTVYCHYNPSIHFDLQLFNKIPEIAQVHHCDYILLCLVAGVFLFISHVQHHSKMESHANAISIFLLLELFFHICTTRTSRQRTLPVLRPGWRGGHDYVFRLQLLCDFAPNLMEIFKR